MDVTIIVPLYKGIRFIPNILEVVQNVYEVTIQKIACSIELIFVNDYPGDCIEECIPSDYCVPITIINNQANEGIHYSRVQGLMQSNGSYIVFLDQDDSLEPQFLLSQWSKIGEADAIVSNGIFRGNRKIIASDKDSYKITDREYYFSSLVEIVSPGQVLIKKASIPEEWKNNIMKKNYCDDAFLWLLMKNAHAKFKVNDEVLYHHKEDGSNASFDWSNTASSLAEMYHIIKERHLLDDHLEYKLKNCIQDKIKKHELYCEIEDKFQKIARSQELFQTFVKKNKLQNISIYGYGYFGKKLAAICRGYNLSVLYAIDKNLTTSMEIDIKSMQDPWPDVDCIVVTAVFEYETIKKLLCDKTNMKVVSLDTFLDIAIEEKNFSDIIKS